MLDSPKFRPLCVETLVIIVVSDSDEWTFLCDLKFEPGFEYGRAMTELVLLIPTKAELVNANTLIGVARVGAYL